MTPADLTSKTSPCGLGIDAGGTQTRWALAYVLLNNRARIAMSMGLPEQARSLMEEYARIKGRDASHWAVIAWIEAESGRLDLARDALRRGLALEPDNDECLEMARDLERLGSPREVRR